MIREAAKAFARQIPAIDALIKQRDELITQRDNLSREVEELRQRLANGLQSQNQLICDRRETILENLNLEGFGLEIGPGHQPLVPKSAGYRVETVDHTDAAQLRKKFSKDGLDLSRVEDVDYITGGGSIFETIGKPGRYDYIVASHLIEHIPDLLGFLKDCERLLKPEGRLALAVPDKRHCFDVFQGLTTTGQILQAHAERASRPSPAVAFDCIAYSGCRGGKIAWLANDDADLSFGHTLTDAKALFDRARTSDDYIDVHVWRFIPASFRLIVSDLNALGEISLQELSFSAPGGFEFFMTLSRDAAGCPLDRLTLARQTI
jgi:SAM-dependent methyltransferase